jgi:hypothetical protein
LKVNRKAKTFKNFPLKSNFCFLGGTPQHSSIERFKEEISSPLLAVTESMSFPFHLIITKDINIYNIYNIYTRAFASFHCFQ